MNRNIIDIRGLLTGGTTPRRSHHFPLMLKGERKTKAWKRRGMKAGGDNT